MLRARRPKHYTTLVLVVWERLFGLVLRSRFSECHSALKTGDFWCPPEPLDSSPGAPGESLEESCLGRVESKFRAKMPALGAERPSVPELWRVVAETMFEIFLNNDFSCFLKYWGSKVA